MSLSEEQVLRVLLSGRLLLLAYVRSIVRDPHMAEDIFQEVSLLALRKRAEVVDETHFQAWIRRAARLEAMNALRREKRQNQVLPEAVLDALDPHWENQRADLAERRAEWLAQCLTRLTDRARQIVVWRYGDGLAPQRLAERLERPINTVYVALARIHKTLGDCIRRKAAGEHA